MYRIYSSLHVRLGLGLPVHDSGLSSKLVLGDLTFPESAFRVQVQVQILVLVPPPDTSFAIGRAPVANETPAFLFHASVCRSERQTILPLSITWSRGIGRVVAIDNRNKKKSLRQAELT